ncbi:MAG: DUF2920 family protein, partial [Shewanella sp.]|uniref:DUF2920 family protein n=1 Tax=Shewanella sp. TaxID=50422 RepID=UPI003F3030BD
ISPWTLSAEQPNTFNASRAQIRGFSLAQIQQMAQLGGTDTSYVFCHAINDSIAPTKDKVSMASAMVDCGFKNLQMNVLNQSNIDGDLIKSMEHGMGLSMRKFFALAYAMINQHGQPFSAKPSLKTSYLCDKETYHFDYSNTAVTAYITAC